ncbi:outer membrane lipoprotein-sorting protein [Psychromonas sp. Urea-02u-13]|uniref:outer membrane lipoprotein-sorting protein n=1 Tax=Psychromonas sp. Urea-02u-13 TaxID=2058326 RepID=UPI0012FE838F|nr:outer membrane lipoprotein-sorting protein [Psychromonas sp. Urea-02u-13]
MPRLIDSLLRYIASFGRLTLLGFLTLVTSTSFATETEQQVQAWIIAADSYRMPFKSGELKSALTLYKNEEKQQSSEFFIQVNEQGDSRVTMLNQRSKGQKVLLTESAMWLYVPRTHKAIRITPMQRLMGQASYGDVSSLSWQHEYQWDKNPVVTKTDSVCFSVTAIRKSATYRKINLCLQKDSLRPVNAQFYLASGKLMKQATYITDIDNPQRISTTKFTQPNKKTQYTLMHNSDYQAKKLSKHIFTRQGFIKR